MQVGRNILFQPDDALRLERIEVLRERWTNVTGTATAATVIWSLVFGVFVWTVVGYDYSWSPLSWLAPIGALPRELAPAVCRELVAAAPPAVHHRPRSADQSCSFEAVQCGIDGAGGQVEPAVAAVAQRFLDRVAMSRPVPQGREQKYVEMTLQHLRVHPHR